jgi:hypothetical protein
MEDSSIAVAIRFRPRNALEKDIDPRMLEVQGRVSIASVTHFIAWFLMQRHEDVSQLKETLVMACMEARIVSFMRFLSWATRQVEKAELEKKHEIRIKELEVGK